MSFYVNPWCPYISHNKPHFHYYQASNKLVFCADLILRKYMIGFKLEMDYGNSTVKILHRTNLLLIYTPMHCDLLIHIHFNCVENRPIIFKTGCDFEWNKRHLSVWRWMSGYSLRLCRYGLLFLIMRTWGKVIRLQIRQNDTELRGTSIKTPRKLYSAVMVRVYDAQIMFYNKK